MLQRWADKTHPWKELKTNNEHKVTSDSKVSQIKWNWKQYLCYSEDTPWALYVMQIYEIYIIQILTAHEGNGPK